MVVAVALAQTVAVALAMAAPLEAAMVVDSVGTMAAGWNSECHLRTRSSADLALTHRSSGTQPRNPTVRW